ADHVEHVRRAHRHRAREEARHDPQARHVAQAARLNPALAPGVSEAGVSEAPGSVGGMEILVGVIALAVGLVVGWLLAAQRAQAKVHAAQLKAGAARAALEAERTTASERFSAVAAEALRQNNEQFLALAGQSLARAGQRQEAQLAQRE